MNSWDYKQFTADQIQNYISDRKFVIPQFQRNLVWSKKQQKNFIDTFERGLPFGSILLYHDEVNNNFQIIDGLQRCYTIFEFVNNPAQFFEEDKIDLALPQSIAEILSFPESNHPSVCKRIRELLITWVKKFYTLDQVKHMQYYEFSEELKKEFDSLVVGHENEIAKLIEPCMKQYIDRCSDLCNTQIPSIIIEGSNENLPMIFERINSGGIKLTKYEIYAATWMSAIFILNDPKFTTILRANCNRYLTKHSSAKVADFDASDFLSKKKVDAFELCFGFSKLLSSEYPHLFSSRKEIEVESIGFTLINSCLGAKNKEAQFLHSRLEKYVGNNIELFLQRVLECVDFVDNRIGKINKFKANSKNKVGPLHTEYQIVSMIASVFLLRYSKFQLDENENIKDFSLSMEISNLDWNKKYEKNFKENATKRYILDILGKTWSGSGDNRMDRVITDKDYYCKNIGKMNFKEELIHWYQTSKAERNEFSKVPNPKEQEKAVLAIIYLPIFKADSQLDGSRYDIEHLATKDLMFTHLKRFSINGDVRLPISSIGNLCLLPQYENRSKKDKTIYSDSKYLQNSGYNLKELEDRFTFTKKNDLDWIENKELSENELRDNYLNFIDRHFQNMLNRILGNFTNL